MKKIKLEPGQVWQVPDKKWIRVRWIDNIYCDADDIKQMEYNFIGGEFYGSHETVKSFLRWIRRNNARLIGMVNFETGRVRVVK